MTYLGYHGVLFGHCKAVPILVASFIIQIDLLPAIICRTMTSNNNRPPPSQWQCDCFDAKYSTSLAWASCNCVLGKECHLLSTHQAMQRQVLQDKQKATHIISGKLHKLMHDAANITMMTYCCKVIGHTLQCINSKDIQPAWMQDKSEENMQRLAWMFYYYGTEIYRMGRSTLTNGE
jgi:hypothetical protein